MRDTYDIQSTEPLMPGHAMTDSPLGWTMYIYQLMTRTRPFYTWSPTELITWAMMYIIQGPYHSMRFYKELYRDGSFTGVGGFGEPPYVSVPVGVTQRPYDGGWNLPPWTGPDEAVTSPHCMFTISVATSRRIRLRKGYWRTAGISGGIPVSLGPLSSWTKVNESAICGLKKEEKISELLTLYFSIFSSLYRHAIKEKGKKNTQ